MSYDPITLFLDAVQKTGLMSAADLLNHSQELRAEGVGSQEEVAAKMVERKALTPYQAERLLLGEGADCVLAGRYHLLEKIGAGGMGSVFRARDTQLDRIVAIKVMAPHNLNNADAVARFKREARALAQLALPNVVQAFDSGEDKGRNFLVMEFVKGIGLDKLVRDKGKIPPTIAADYVYQTAVGMARAHDRGMIHRDLKPANLLLTSDGQIKILDLGLARFLQDQIPDSEVTRDNIAMGTPDYMAPEQFRDAHGVDPRADIYALGCTLYNLIAGIVPFPGSSLSEKANAHANKEPPSVGERCPEIPAGLSLALEKMLAKRPVYRFQTMREVAEALAPYVATSSPSLPSIRQTVSFHGSQIGTMGPRRRHRRPVLIGGGLALVVMIALLAIFPPPWWGRTEKPDGNQQAGQNHPEPPADKKTPPGKEPSKPPEPVKPVPPKVVTIANGLTVAQDGTGQYKTINEALDKVKPGQTIRVLDSAIPEVLALRRAIQYAGITLEAVQGAILQAPPGTIDLVSINNVANLTLRGFHLHGEKPVSSLVVVTGKCPGLILEKLDLDCPMAKPVAQGIYFGDASIGEKGTKILVRNNVCQHFEQGISVNGCGGNEDNYHTPFPCGQINIQGNEIIDCHYGIRLNGSVIQVQVMGNKVLWATQVGIQLDNLLEGSRDILIANNSLLESAEAFRVWDTAPKGENIRICNNLFLGHAEKDMIFLDNKGKQSGFAGPGNGGSVTEKWNLQNNWRELKTTEVKWPGWIPPSAKDKVLKQIEVMSRHPKDKDFLRPKKDSPLATQGAGTEDLGLPTYVGAVTPEGAEPWNWQWTWDAFMNKTLTVSQDAKDQARFNSINAALEKVKPGWTIRVLDDAMYEENLLFNDPARQAGATLDSVRKATIQANHKMNLIEVKGVSGLTLKGLRLQATKPEVCLLGVFPGSDGLNLERVEFVAPPMEFVGPDKNCRGLDIIGGEAPKAGSPPIRVHDCLFQNLADGIQFLGTDGTLQLVIPPKRIFVCDNVFRHCHQPILFYGPAQDVLVAGNKIIGAKGSGIHVEAMMPGTDNILVANNSIFDSQFPVRFWSTTVKGSKVVFQSNLILAPVSPDMVFVNAVGFGDKLNGPGDIPSLLKVWHFSHNWREAKKPVANDVYSKGWIPPNPNKDVLQDNIDVLSRNPNHKDFLRPAKDSPLATGGAGKDDPDLPTYVGAVPPEGVEAWDWQKTWKAKFERR